MVEVAVTTKAFSWKVPQPHKIPNPAHVTRYEVWLGDPRKPGSRMLNYNEIPQPAGKYVRFASDLSPYQGFLRVQVPTGDRIPLYGKLQYFTNGQLIETQIGGGLAPVYVSRGVHINAASQGRRR